MIEDRDLKVIYRHTVLPNGFLWKARYGNVVSSEGEELVEVTERYLKSLGDTTSVNKLVFACLFDVPWILENAAVKLREIGENNTANNADTISIKLRKVIDDWIWLGLDEYFVESADPGSGKDC